MAVFFEKYPIARVQSNSLKFQMEGLKKKLSISTEKQEGYLSFTVLTPAKSEVVIWIHPDVLINGFEVSEKLVVAAAKANDLSRVILYRLLQNNKLLKPEQIKPLAKTIRSYFLAKDPASNEISLHLSRKDYKKLPKNLYISLCNEKRFAAFGDTTLEGTKCMRKDFVIRDKETLELANRAIAMSTLYDTDYGILPLLGAVRYTSPAQRVKVILFYPIYPTLKTQLESGIRLSLQQQASYIHALFANPALQSGAHNQLTLEQLFLCKEELLIGGMEYFQKKSIKGDWEELISQKATVWSAALVAYSIIMNSANAPFPPETEQAEITKIVENALLPKPWKAFFSALFIVDPSRRPDMPAALKELYKQFPDLESHNNRCLIS